MPTDQSAHIILDKELRRDIDAIIQRLRHGMRSHGSPFGAEGVKGSDVIDLSVAGRVEGRSNRERSLAVTKLQEAVMWLGMDLKAINEENPGAVENPYPNSKDPSNTTIDKTADGLKL